MTLLATIIVEGGLHRRFEKRRVARMLEHITDHFILCGYGRIGSIIAGSSISRACRSSSSSAIPIACARRSSEAGSRSKPTRAGKRCSRRRVFTAPED